MKLEHLEISPTGLDAAGNTHPLEKAQEIDKDQDMDGKESPLMFTVSLFKKNHHKMYEIYLIQVYYRYIFVAMNFQFNNLLVCYIFMPNIHF